MTKPWSTLFAAALLATATLANACSFSQPELKALDPTLANPNDKPPRAPRVKVDWIARGRDWKVSSSPCSDTGIIALMIPASRANKDLLFSFEVISGNSEPRIFEAGHYTAEVWKRKFRFVFPWLDGAQQAQEPLDLKVKVTPFRRSGLAGTPTVITIKDGGRAADSTTWKTDPVR